MGAHGVPLHRDKISAKIFTHGHGRCFGHLNFENSNLFGFRASNFELKSGTLY